MGAEEDGGERERMGKVGAEFFMVALQACMTTTYRVQEASK